MENKNTGLKILVIILSLLVVALTGYLVYDKVLSKEDNNDTTNKDEIDTALLNSLYDMLGINNDNNYYGDCLNYFISNNNYQNNAQKIFSLYASYKNLNTNRHNNENCNSDCEIALSCAECASISKEEGNKIIKLYNLNNLTLKELPGIDTDYVYVSGIPVGTCHYKVTHNTNAEYLDKDSVMITDNQVVTDYEWPEESQINSTKNQTVTYTFEKDNNGNYYLNSVNVK